jgi:uncharacterized protein involved in exopolysaccharide biosynthesis
MQNKEMTMAVYLKMVWKWRKLVLRVTGIATLLAVVISLLLPKWWQSSAVVLPIEQQSGGASALQILGGLGLGGISSSVGESRLVAILRSRALLSLLINRFDLKAAYRKKTFDETLKALRDRMDVQVADEGQIVVAISDRDPRKACKMVEYILSALDSIDNQLNMNLAHLKRVFIGKRLQETRADLAAYQDSLEQFLAQEGILSINSQIDAAVEQAAWVQAEIAKVRIKLTLAKLSLSTDNPKVQELQLQLKEISRIYDEFYIDQGKKSFYPNFGDIPALQLTWMKLNQSIQYYTQLLEYLGQQYEQYRIEELKDLPTFQVLDTPRIPEKRFSPKRKLIVISVFLLTIIMMILLSLFMEIFQDDLQEIKKIIRSSRSDQDSAKT